MLCARVAVARDSSKTMDILGRFMGVPHAAARKARTRAASPARVCEALARFC